jgi:hypothetical protein
MRTITRRCGIGLATIVSASILTFAGSAFATDGRTAVGLCIDSTATGARCAWSVNDKGEIDICNKSGCVYCPSATGTCTVARKRPRPDGTLPPGTLVVSALGTFEVTTRFRQAQADRLDSELDDAVIACMLGSQPIPPPSDQIPQ